MPAVKGRHSRSHNVTEPTVPIQGRVSVQAHQAARAAADAAGVSMAKYLEALLLFDEQHRVVRPNQDAIEQGGLPLTG